MNRDAFLVENALFLLVDRIHIGPLDTGRNLRAGLNRIDSGLGEFLQSRQFMGHVPRPLLRLIFIRPHPARECRLPVA